MNDCVPIWHMDGSTVPFSPELISEADKLQPIEKEVQELVWRNGRPTTQNYNQKSPRQSNGLFPGGSEALCGAREKPDLPESGVIDATLGSAGAPPPPFIQEDEMASWLHYPLDDAFERDLYRDLFSAPAVPGRNSQPPAVTRLPEVVQSSGAMASPAPRPVTFPPRPASESPAPKVVNFSLFAKSAGLLNGTDSKRSTLRSDFTDRSTRVESTVVDSCETPSAFRSLSLPANRGESSKASVFTSETMEGSKAPAGSASELRDSTHLSSPPGSRDRKRKGRETDESESHSEDAGESVNEKEAKRLATKRRNRAAEIHNLSERRRRDRINEKMKALQELIPRCNKSDKASMLDEAIEYLKSLQMQVQMMSMGCGLPPMMYPGQCLPPMAMGMGMGMGMGMVAGSSRPMLPFPPVMPGLAVPSPGASPLYPSLPMPGVHMQVPLCAKTEQMTTPLDPLLNPAQPTTLAEYQQYLSQFHMAAPPRVSLPPNTNAVRNEEPPPSSQ